MPPTASKPQGLKVTKVKKVTGFISKSDFANSKSQESHRFCNKNATVKMKNITKPVTFLTV